MHQAVSEESSEHMIKRQTFCFSRCMHYLHHLKDTRSQDFDNSALMVTRVHTACCMTVNMQAWRTAPGKSQQNHTKLPLAGLASWVAPPGLRSECTAPEERQLTKHAPTFSMRPNCTTKHFTSPCLHNLLASSLSTPLSSKCTSLRHVDTTKRRALLCYAYTKQSSAPCWPYRFPRPRSRSA